MRKLVSRSACAFLIICRTHIAPCHRARRLPFEARHSSEAASVFSWSDYGRYGCCQRLPRPRSFGAHTAGHSWASVVSMSYNIRISVHLQRSHSLRTNTCLFGRLSQPLYGTQPYYRQRCVTSGDYAWLYDGSGAKVARIMSRALAWNAYTLVSLFARECRTLLAAWRTRVRWMERPCGGGTSISVRHSWSLFAKWRSSPKKKSLSRSS